jgi:glutamyl-tRNA synthetase
MAGWFFLQLFYGLDLLELYIAGESIIFYPQEEAMDSVRTRFAPSPTGFLHIGGLRTALFAYLFARHHGGRYILRIEDTDRSRFVEGALEDIMDSLRWIGIRWDEGPDTGGPFAPYQQSLRREIYEQFTLQLIEHGHAYRCYCTPERLSALREEQKKRGLDPGYDRRCRNLTPEERKAHEDRGDQSVIRLKVPLEGETAFEDVIRGTISKPNSALDDLVLLKSDGFPTYHLANVVDDHLMDISHVIRGDEWISSTPRHILLYRAFGWEPPQFAHVPVILAPGGGKLSKRHGATMVREFRDRGYLREALLNFIALLGWSLDDKTEFFSMEELVERFDLGRVNKAPAVFSFEKLDWFNGMYIRKKTIPELFALVLPHLMADGILSEGDEEERRAYIMRILPLVQERLNHLTDITDRIWFFFDERFEIREPDALIPKKGTREDALRIIRRADEELEVLASFEEQDIESVMRRLVEELGLKTGQVFMTLRIALTGSRVSPGLFETMAVMGKSRVIDRLKDARTILEE